MDIFDKAPDVANEDVSKTIASITSMPIESISDENKPKSFFGYFITVFRYILIIYLVGYIILLILNNLDMLPDWLKEKFTPYDIVKIIRKQERKNKNIDNELLATKIQKDDEVVKEKEKEKEYIPPTPVQNKVPKPDDASSSTQSSKIANKSGYCYIGEDRGFRSCIKVKAGDRCMSEDIYPTEAVCVNPNLRP
jgi:hypothetical protein